MGWSRSVARRLLVLLSLGVPVAETGCAAAADDTDASESEVNENKNVEEELRLLAGSEADLQRLLGLLDQRLATLAQAKEAAEKKAEADVASYSDRQWDRSWFRRDERAAAVAARARDLFDRPQRRAVDATKAKKLFVTDLLALVRQGRAGTPQAPTFEGWYLRNGYYETAIALMLNDKLGLERQAGAIISGAFRNGLPVFGRPSDGPEASNIDRTGDPAHFWRQNPTFSTVWHPRSPAEVTPARLFHGPWFGKAPTPRLPREGEVWKLAGLRSQSADGAHASVDIAFEGAKLKMKLQRDNPNGFFVEPAYARLLWAMGYETDPQVLLRDVRVEPRVFLAAHASAERVGLRAPRTPEDEIVPGRPPGGIAIAGISVSPGARWLSVRFRDGREETGDAALARLREATNDRAAMDAMDSVLVRRAYGEVDPPNERDAIGPWDYDAVNHVTEREIRAIGIIMNGWLGSNDLKFNNVRFDVDRASKTRPLPYFHTLSDVGGTVTELGWEVGVRFDQPRLHPGTNRVAITAFDKATLSDVRWGIALLGRLTEEQIVACLATSAFDDASLALMTEKLLARRDDLVRSFGLDRELGLLRPNGANRNPPPRHFSPP